MRIISTIITGILLLNTCVSGKGSLPANPSTSYYDVTIHEDDIRSVHVEASIPLSHDTLWMSQGEVAPLVNGFATFVHDLTATDSKGNGVELISIGKGIWKVKSPVPVIHLKYYVDIKHDTVQWKVSAAFARGYAVEGILFFAGCSVFIAPKGPDSAKITVHFNLPGAWEIVTPYNVVKNSINTYEADNLHDLWRNGNFIGRFVKEEIHVGQLNVLIAGTFPMKDGVTLFKDALTKIINSYSYAMGGAPGGKLAIMGSVSSLSYGGEAFSRSISLMFNEPPGLQDKSQWGYILAHEVFHLWNGAAIVPVTQSQAEWFTEGFTEYMSKLTALRTGFISKEEFLQQIAGTYDNYTGSAGRISMQNAGTEKGENYSLIYYGGMSAAIALDIECLRATNHDKGFIEIMKTMYSKFGITKQPYTYQDIIKICSDVAGRDLSDFFSDYIAGLKIIPLNKYLSSAGLHLHTVDGRSLIDIKSNVSTEENNLLAAFLYKR